MKVADIRFTWTKSPSVLNSQTFVLTVDGTETTATLPPEVQSFTAEVKAMSSVRFKVVSTNPDGQETVSSDINFTIDSLEAPAPATNLGWTIIGVRDVPDAPPPEGTAPAPRA